MIYRVHNISIRDNQPNMHLCVSTRVSFYLPTHIYISIYPSIHLSIYLPVHKSPGRPRLMQVRKSSMTGLVRDPSTTEPDGSGAPKFRWQCQGYTREQYGNSNYSKATSRIMDRHVKSAIRCSKSLPAAVDRFASGTLAGLGFGDCFT